VAPLVVVEQPLHAALDPRVERAGVVWVWAEEISTAGVTVASTASVVSLSGGALMANIVSVVLLVVETVSFQRR